MRKKYKHIPVLADDVLKNFPDCQNKIKYIDGTLGYGGHSSLILKKNSLAEMVGIDRDTDALKLAGENLSFAEDRIRLFHGNFSSLKKFAAKAGWASVNAVLLDLGMSSIQLDDPRRGFSFRLNGPLDMRMDQSSQTTASRFLNKAPVEKLAEIFRFYGEIKESRKLARLIVEERQEKPFVLTEQLRNLCNKNIKKTRKNGPSSAMLCFQALRIAVNDELSELRKALNECIELLAPGGRIMVISFHSLEDRIVKNFFRKESKDCICSPGLPVCICSHKRNLKIINKKPLTAGAEELNNNSRASSAKLRVAEKI